MPRWHPCWTSAVAPPASVNRWISSSQSTRCGGSVREPRQTLPRPSSYESCAVTHGDAREDEPPRGRKRTTYPARTKRTIARDCWFCSWSGSCRLAACANTALYRVHHGPEVLVFPESEHKPTGSPEFAIVPSITFDVRRQLLTPPIPIGVRCRAMYRTGMPEAAVKEHRDPLRRENQVRTGSRHARNGAIHPKTQPASM